MRAVLLLLPALTHALVSTAGLMDSAGTYHYLVVCIAAVGLILAAGLMSGLTVGMMGLSELDLDLKFAIGSPDEKALAYRLLPLLHRHHLLLVTLLLANSAATETLPLILCEILPEAAAMVISTAAVVIFGEILPVAFCTGPGQVWIAARCSFIVRIVICIFFPVAYPISLILDWLFPEKKAQVGSEESKRLLKNTEDDLSEVQVRLIHSAMRGKDKETGLFPIPLDSIYAISMQTVLDKATLEAIRRKGFSRVPVYGEETGKSVVGVLKTKDLIGIKDGITLKETGIELEPCIFAPISLNLISLFHLFRTKRTQMVFISSPSSCQSESGELSVSSIVGVVTQRGVLRHLVSFADSRQRAGGVLQRSFNSYSQGKHYSHLHYLSPRAGVLFHQ